MKQFTRLISNLIVISVFSVLTTFAEEAEIPQPSGTVMLSTTSIAAGVGINWGTGTLTFEGKDYPFTVKGLSVMDLGISTASAEGKVFHLTKLSDFSGKYAAAEAAYAVGKGKAGVTMKNTKGVVLNLRAATKGVQLTLGGKGLNIELQEKEDIDQSEEE